MSVDNISPPILQQLSDKQSTFYTSNQASGFGTIDFSVKKSCLVNLQVEDLFTVTKSSKPAAKQQEIKKYVNCTAQANKEYLLFQRKSKIQSYLNKIQIKACDSRIELISWQLHIINKQLIDLERVKILQCRQKEELMEKARRRQLVHEAVQFRRFIIGETKIKYCQQVSFSKINKQA